MSSAEQRLQYVLRDIERRTPAGEKPQLGFLEQVAVGFLMAEAHEEQQRNRIRQQREREEQEQQERFHGRLSDLRDALLHWRNIAPDLDGYARANWQSILEDEEDILAYYHDPDAPFGDAKRRQTMVWFALYKARDELEHLLPPDNAPWILAGGGFAEFGLNQIFRRFHGDWAEELLPRARRLRDAALGLVDEDAGSPDPNDPLALLPRSDRADFRRRLQGVTSLRALDRALEQELDSYVASLDGGPEPGRRDAIQKYEANLKKLKRDYAAARGWLA